MTGAAHLSIITILLHTSYIVVPPSLLLLFFFFYAVCILSDSDLFNETNVYRDQTAIITIIVLLCTRSIHETLRQYIVVGVRC